MASRADFEFWSKAQAGWNGQFANIAGARVKVLADCRVIGQHLIRDGFWEAWIALAICRRLGRGMRCLDVGANMGYYTALFRVQCGESGHVWSVEPSPRLVDLLHQTIRENGWQNVDVISAAAGDHNGPGTLYTFDDRYYNGSMVSGWCGYATPTPCEVHTFDSIAADCIIQAGGIDICKIDVDGSEEDLWHFGRQGLAEIPLVILEVCPHRYYNVAAFLGNIRRLFPVLRMIDFEGGIRRVDISEIAAKPSEDYMLWLER